MTDRFNFVRTRFSSLIIYFLVACSFLLQGYSIVLAQNTSETHTISILTIGNSFARNACQYLEEISNSVDEYKIEITRANIGGCSLEQHANLIDSCEKNASYKPYQGKYTLKELLKMHSYDFVTIQQVSSQSFKPESYECIFSNSLRVYFP
jgi:hypothetical protein